MRKSLLLLLLLFLVSALQAQLVVNNTLTPQQLVEDILAGAGVEVSNITFTGNAIQIGSFDGQNSNIGFNSGILLSSGDINTAIGPNNDGGAGQSAGGGSDPDLDQIVDPNGSFDAAILEFDFIPVSDTIKFSYIFASEEYLEYVNSGVNDAFGFFISGPGINGPFTNNAENIALIPGTTTPVTIDNLNDQSFSQYYFDNENPPGQTIQYDGFSLPLQAIYPVVCGQTYHLKLAISDAGDDVFDSGVFLKAGSLSSIGLDLNLQTISGQSVIYESCTSVDQLIASRPSAMNIDTTIVALVITGTATEGVDYTDIPDTITFLPGVDTVFIELQAFFDNITEGNETVQVTATYISLCGDTIVVVSSFEISENPPVLTMNAPDVIIKCPDDEVILTAQAGNGFDPYTYQWSNGTLDDSTMVAIATNGTIAFKVTATDACGNVVSDSVHLTLNQTLAIDSITVEPASSCLDNGAVNAYVSGATGSVAYNWSGPGPSGGVISNGSSAVNLGEGMYYLTVVDNVCVAEDSAFVEKLDPPVASFSIASDPGAAPQIITFSNASQNADSYDWDFGNGNDTLVDNLGGQSSLYPENTTYTVTLYAIQQSCVDSMSLSFTLIAIPSYIQPNIFTPNGDAANEYFTLNPINFASFSYSIFNRWGNLLFEGDLSSPKWDGTANNGKEAEEGVYFYKYSGVGLNGDVKEGHGYFHLKK